MIQNPTPENHEEYILQRNRTIRKEKRESEKEFIKSMEEYSFNPRIFFKKCK